MIRRIALLLAAIIALLAAAFFIGPVYRIDPRVTQPALPGDLDAWLAAAERSQQDIVPGTEKSIVWAHADRRRTPLAIIYLHGYSATRKEVEPLCDRLAAQLGANLYYTRLAGHGREGRALGQATFAGAAALAQRSPLSPTALREQVTSKGGTTHAAITSLDADGVKAAFVRALHAARTRAEELGRG